MLVFSNIFFNYFKGLFVLQNVLTLCTSLVFSKDVC